MQREETDRMGQMERGHTAEVQPDCMTEAIHRRDLRNAYQKQCNGIPSMADDRARRTYQRRGIVPHGKYACG